MNRDTIVIVVFLLVVVAVLSVYYCKVIRAKLQKERNELKQEAQNAASQVAKKF